MGIFIHYQNVSFRLYQSTKVKMWIEETVACEGSNTGRIDYFFIDDKSQREINSEFLEHHYNTDVITFDYSEGKRCSGEIYIAVETVRRNALEYSAAFGEEMLRVMIHGVLHLLGYKDKTMAEKDQIREKENYYLRRYKDGKSGV